MSAKNGWVSEMAAAQLSLEGMMANMHKKEAWKGKLQVVYEPAGRAREYAALAANLYSGCDHGCKYCYAPAATRKTIENFATVSERFGILSKLEADCKLLKGAKVEPVLLSFTCDPYSNFDVEHKLTRRAIQIFKRYNIAFQVLTKGGSRAKRDFDLYNIFKDIFASTLTFIDEKQSLEWEPNAATPVDRMQAVKDAHTLGIKTWVSLEPVIDPVQSLQIIEEMHEYVDLFKVGTLNHHAIAKSIDWRKFGNDAIKRLEYYNKQYYIKDDLRAYL